MALAKLRQDEPSAATIAPAPQLSTKIDGFPATPSPAVALQQRLAQHAAAGSATDIAKWSPRRSLALIVSASVVLWMAILMAGAEAIKLIA
jgi:hypothetical protein